MISRHLSSYRKLIFPALLLAFALVFLVISVIDRSRTDDGHELAAKIERKLDRRLDRLEGYISDAIRQDSTEWLDIKRFPEDMVLYKYDYDTLQSWVHVFPVDNDDIRQRMVYQRISRPEYGLSSPLSFIGGDWSFVNLGKKWYVARMAQDGATKVVAGLEVCTMENGREVSHLNPRLADYDDCLLTPVTGNVGYPVCRDGKALFVINAKPDEVTVIFANSIFRWIALCLIVLALLTLLAGNSTRRRCIIIMTALATIFALAMHWGAQMQDKSELFSPALFAGDGILWSFGALLITNTFISLSVLCIYLARMDIFSEAVKNKRTAVIQLTALTALAALVIAYVAFSLSSLVSNGNVSIEIQWFQSGVAHSVAALVSYTLLLASLMQIITMSVPAIYSLTGRRPRIISNKNAVWSAVVFAGSLFILSTQASFRKETEKANTWAERLAVDRDLTLEVKLRGIEDGIANDNIITILANVQNGDDIIANRIRENYLSDIEGEYDIKLSACLNDDRDCMEAFARKMNGGEPIAPESRFVCKYDPYGHAGYAALFLYLTNDGTVVRMLLEINSKENREASGYYSIFDGLSRPGSVPIPSFYSYARYIDGKLASYKGTCAYPTLLNSEFGKRAATTSFFRTEDDIHFVNHISDNEIIIISRNRRSVLGKISAALLDITIATIILLVFCQFCNNGERMPKRRTFKRQITITVNLAIFISLLSLAGISIKFVFDRNKVNSYNLMSTKINTLRTLTESRCADVSDCSEMTNQEFRTSMLNLSAFTKSDISLYTPDGKVFLSTVGEVYERMLLSPRISDKAYRKICREHQRLAIIPEKFQGKRYFSLYAPIMNSRDELVAIVNSPYSTGNAMMMAAIPHAILLIVITLALLVIFSAAAERVINRLLKPLNEIGRKMDEASLEDLKCIEYDHDDEIRPLIDSYNLMAKDLAESAKVMAQTERNNAWSQMARQVAHEIKNPLTPIKLEIQRLVRLKQKNAPSWSEKFDSVADIILEHIDMLTDTANEFSTFAKLYTEDPVEMDLDKTLQEQISIFDNRENITISYIGLKDALIMGPRPQLIRVFVNLITNAIQALEIRQKERAEAGGEYVQGQISILLRHSPEEGYYDVVVEDNGPGVPEENLDKIFTPNFTTKTGGTGLGLAMCRSIVDKCEGKIFYRRSYSLGGASFTVRLPKNL